MKVNRPNIANLVTRIYKQQVQNKAEAGAPSRCDTSGTSKKDCVKISSLSEVLKKELSRLDENNPARAEKLSRLSRQIEAGEYRTDSKELAALILKDLDKGKGE